MRSRAELIKRFATEAGMPQAEPLAS
jgi:hypothetical protein